jgi:tetratricopeptide (TPR) repeat protein
MSERDDGGLRRAAAELPVAGPCPGEVTLLAFYRGELEDSEAEALREHLARCRDCLALARDARSFLAALRAPELSRTVPRPRRRRLAPWAAAAAAVALAALGVAVFREHRPAQRPADLVWRGDDDAAAYAAAMEHFRAGRFEAAESALESWVLAHPADDRARLDLAVARIRVGRRADARRELVELAERGDDAIRTEARRWLAELDRGGPP